MPESETKTTRSACGACCPTDHPTENPKFIKHCYCACPVGHTGPHDWPQCSGLAAVLAPEKIAEESLQRVYFWAVGKDPSKMLSLIPSLMADHIIQLLKEMQSKKAVYRWEFSGWKTLDRRPLRAWSLQRNGENTGGVLERIDGFYNWEARVTPSATYGERTTQSLAQSAVEAIVRAHYGDEREPS